MIFIVPVAVELVFPRWTIVAIHLVITLIVNALEHIPI